MKEKRNINNSGIETIIDSRKITGYALLFSTESRDLGGFVEVISPDALNGVIEKSDVLCVLNHNVDKGVLARSNKGLGSLKLTIDDKGLKYEFDAPNTALGDELLEGIRRGDITASSFVFTTKKDSWTKRNDGTYLRTLQEIDELFDVSPVYQPAYDATSVRVDKRGFDEAKALDRQKELEIYFNNKKEKLKAYEIY
jgi:HK97 family phage prohead protease